MIRTSAVIIDKLVYFCFGEYASRWDEVRATGICYLEITCQAE